jgi:hypothetical protein
VHFEGRDWSVSELASAKGIDRRTLQSRLAAGATAEEALACPVRAYPPEVRRDRPSNVKLRQRPSGASCERCWDPGQLHPFGPEQIMLCQTCRSAAQRMLRGWISRSC